MKKIIAIVGFLGLFASQMATSSAAYFNSDPIIRCETQITSTLQKGSENPDVYVLQQLLVRAGFLSAHPNGYFGNQTAQAVRAFQYENYLPVTGIVGPSTRDAINERLCDTDLVDNSYSYGGYGYNGYSVPTTYVGNNDPFVQVVTPSQGTPAVYATPQANSQAVRVSTIATSYTSPSSQFIFDQGTSLPLAQSSQIVSSGIVYNPSSGYTYGLVPRSGSVTVSSPQANSAYNEGDTVSVRWSTDNIQVNSFSISLESSITGQSRVVGVVSGNSYSFTLSRDLLDAICSGTCNNNQQGSFKVVVSTPTTDIAGITSTLRAAISPITVRRPLSPGQVNISASKTPVNSGEIFKLYINVPTGTSWNSNLAGNYSIRLRAICNPNVSVSIAGTPCGQDFTIPFALTSIQQEIPAVITNTTWYKQDVTFQLTVVNLLGQTIGTGQTVVTSNSVPFNW